MITLVSPYTQEGAEILAEELRIKAQAMHDSAHGRCSHPPALIAVRQKTVVDVYCQTTVMGVHKMETCVNIKCSSCDSSSKEVFDYLICIACSRFNSRENIIQTQLVSGPSHSGGMGSYDEEYNFKCPKCGSGQEVVFYPDH